MIVLLTAQAERDLEDIGDYIARDNPVRAISFLRELRQACDGLATMPLRFPIVERFKMLGVRRRVHGRYLIFYRVGAENIEILHILHGAGDYDAILLSD